MTASINIIGSIIDITGINQVAKNSSKGANNENIGISHSGCVDQ